MDERAMRLAEVVLKYSLKIEKGEKLLIAGDEATLPFLKEVFKKAVTLGAKPTITVDYQDMNAYLIKNGNEDQMKYLYSNEIQAHKTADALLNVMGTNNTRNFASVDPEKINIAFGGAAKELNEIVFDRMEKGELRSCVTLYPLNGNAQQANMSLSDYEDFVYNACLVDQEDVLKKWTKVMDNQERICKLLDTKKQLRIVSKDTDISMSVEGRKWINCCGKVNFPDGEVFTGPIEDSIEGYISFSYPGVCQGKDIEDIRLRFENGKVVEATAGKGEEVLKSMLETDERAKFLGEIGIGTNYGIQKFTKNMLFDEKIGGTIHLALGRSLPESLGKNISNIHWDLLCDMTDGEIYADGELIYKDKRFII